MEQDQWYIWEGRGHRGPYNPDEIKNFVKRGKIHEETHLWCKGLAEWTPYKQTELQNEKKVIAARASALPALPNSAKTMSEEEILKMSARFQATVEHAPELPQEKRVKTSGQFLLKAKKLFRATLVLTAIAPFLITAFYFSVPVAAVWLDQKLNHTPWKGVSPYIEDRLALFKLQNEKDQAIALGSVKEGSSAWAVTQWPFGELEMKIRPHPVFSSGGKDLVLSTSVNYSRALLRTSGQREGVYIIEGKFTEGSWWDQFKKAKSALLKVEGLLGIKRASHEFKIQTPIVYNERSKAKNQLLSAFRVRENRNVLPWKEVKEGAQTIRELTTRLFAQQGQLLESIETSADSLSFKSFYMRSIAPFLQTLSITLLQSSKRKGIEPLAQEKLHSLHIVSKQLMGGMAEFITKAASNPRVYKVWVESESLSWAKKRQEYESILAEVINLSSSKIKLASENVALYRFKLQDAFINPKSLR